MPRAQAQDPTRKEDWQRWNDYGIGLLLQGDLKARRLPFEKVTRRSAESRRLLNIGRAALQEGDVARARTVLEKALALNPKLARTNFFYGSTAEETGDYDQAACISKSCLLSILATAWREQSWACALLQKKVCGPGESTAAGAPSSEGFSAYNLMLCYNGS